MAKKKKNQERGLNLGDARQGFQSIRRLFRRIVHCARRPLVALRLARLFGAGRGGRGRCLRGRGGGRCPVGGSANASVFVSCHIMPMSVLGWGEDKR